MREAKPDLLGVALYDRLGLRLHDDPNLVQLMWQRREIENYLATPEALRAYAKEIGGRQHGEPFAKTTEEHMDAAIAEVSAALATLGKTDPFGPDTKASDDFLDPVFGKFFEKLGLPRSTVSKSDYHTLAPLLGRDSIAPEVSQKLDAILEVARSARPVGPAG